MNCLWQPGCSQTCGRTPLCIRSSEMLIIVKQESPVKSYHAVQGRFFLQILCHMSCMEMPFEQLHLQVVGVQPDCCPAASFRYRSHFRGGMVVAALAVGSAWPLEMGIAYRSGLHSFHSAVRA
jgi:hypothetical protein